jgi:hypothetical protein
MLHVCIINASRLLQTPPLTFDAGSPCVRPSSGRGSGARGCEIASARNDLDHPVTLVGACGRL